MGIPDVQTNWDAYEQAFPSAAEYAASAPSDTVIPETDEVEDGQYTLALVHMSDPVENKFPDPRQKNPKPIVFLYFRVIEADDPSDIGKLIRKKVTFSGHPMSSAYVFLTAAYGGTIPPEEKPTFAKMKDMQIKVFLQTRGGTGNDGKAYTFQAWEAIRAVKDKLPVPPF